MCTDKAVREGHNGGVERGHNGKGRELSRRRSETQARPCGGTWRVDRESVDSVRERALGRFVVDVFWVAVWAGRFVVPGRLVPYAQCLLVLQPLCGSPPTCPGCFGRK